MYQCANTGASTQVTRGAPSILNFSSILRTLIDISSNIASPVQIKGLEDCGITRLYCGRANTIAIEIEIEIEIEIAIAIAIAISSTIAILQYCNRTLNNDSLNSKR